jgi:ParB/RepB/Spo0J family partition protein
MNLREITREFKDIPLHLLDPPQLDARMDRSEEQLEELAVDIGRRGVILPLAVVPVDGRYEIVDGYCRYLASRRAQLVCVPCVVYPEKDTALEGVKYAANLFRQDMSAAEEATFFHHLFAHECGQDIDQVCALVNRKRSYVDARLQLVLGDEDVFEAVRRKEITLGVAAELNKIPAEDYRRYYLRHAIKSGATVGVVTGWVAEWKAIYANRVDDQPPPAPASAPIVTSSYDPFRCYICGKTDPRHIPEQVSIHAHCKLAILDPMLDAYRGEPVKTDA